MADILYYAALDKYLYQDMQLAAASDQKNRANDRLAAAKVTLTNCTTCAGCCLCCLCCAECDKRDRQQALDTINCINATIRMTPTDTDNWETLYDNRKFPSDNCSSYDGFFCVGDPTACAYDPQDEACLNSCCCTCGCPSGGYYRCGGCYQWTVPTGVCCIEAEIWGAGAWTTGGCCCGGSPFGMSGSFIFAQLAVCPGEVLCFCAGCAACCTCACSNGASIMQNSGSTFCGPGFRFCASGATTWNQNQTTNNYAYGSYCCRRAGSPACIGAPDGGCWCNNGQNWCQDATCGLQGGPIPMGVGMNYPCICYDGTTRTSPAWVVGIPGMHGCWCYNSSNYGYYMSPPIPGFVNVSQCCLSHTSNGCHGCNCRAECGFNPWPGQGGTRSVAMNTQTSCKGDNGRTGWIRVRYCCI